ncbi:hypothetical protein ACIRL3_24375 [Streptomyces sp. NPDC102384]|uniref:hypothetical protein n=1 Tax=Streptomyces sp. NPDC102384 TaxID=3366166 RepID=UPI0037F8FBF8
MKPELLAPVPRTPSPAPADDPSQALPAEGSPDTAEAVGRRYEQQVHGGQALQGERITVTNYWNGEAVTKTAVTAADLVVSGPEGYVPPRDPGKLVEAERLLASYGVVVLSAPPGNGRRTTALKLLRTARASGTDAAASGGRTLYDLEAEWAKVRLGALPRTEREGYVLDLTELPTTEPPARFTSELADYGAQGLCDGWLLVVLTTPQVWKGGWLDASRDFTLSLPSPDARALVERELQARAAGSCVHWLHNRVFDDIWRTNPPAEDARRLANIITEARTADDTVPQQAQLDAIVAEFQGWHVAIEGLLNRGPDEPGKPSLLANRITVWAGALLHGGEIRSVLKAADALMTDLEIPREAADVLGGATSSQRLESARITPRVGHAFHDEDKHDLAPAILANLWSEFPTERDLLNKWAVAVAADLEVSEEDARHVTARLLHLATTRRDGDILDAIATGLSGSRRSLAARALADAALAPQIGTYVRNRLYGWARKSTSEPHILALVAEVCGGRLGEAQPRLALTRLRWVASNSELGATPVTRAFQNLIVQHPHHVREAAKTWFKDANLEEALAVFLAMASSDEGATFLLESVVDDASRGTFVRAWQLLLSDDEARESANLRLSRWGELVEEGVLPSDDLVDLLAEVYEPSVYRSGLERFFAAGSDFEETFWGRVLGETLVRRKVRRRREEQERAAQQ